MNESQSIATPNGADEWYALDTHVFERLPLRARWFIVLFLVASGPFLYLSLYLNWLNTGQWDRLAAREPVSAVLICVFILVYLQFIKRTSIRVLGQLRSVIPISEKEYQRHARLILNANWRIELALLGVAIALLFAAGQFDFSGQAPRTFFWWVATVYTSLFTILALWIFLAMVYNGVRSSLALRGLARSPLIVNAFDSTSLLPFGRLTVLHSLASVVVVSIPLVVMGLPTGVGGQIVLGLAFFSLAVLFVPLWGVHRQIVNARERVIDLLAGELMRVQASLLAGGVTDADAVKALHDKAERLSGLRKLALSGPSWPFRDYGSLARVVTAVFLPTVVAFLSMFIERFIFPMFQP